MSNPDVVRSDDPDEIRSDIERTRRELGQDVDALADKVNPAKAMERQTDKVRHAATRLKDRVMGTASEVVDSTQDAVGHAGEAVADAPRKVASATQGNPIAAGLIAFGVGWLLSSLVPASRPERDMADKIETAAAPLVDEVRDVAMESADHLREPARDAVDAVNERAAEAMDTVKAEGADAASEVQTEAKHAAERQME
jgi:ElaB/YqjD/DUF883 family membrane-anchored ribosome-binding protein